MAQSQAYPKWKYHYTGKSIMVKTQEEEAALGGGWANHPTEFAAYQGPRRAAPQHDPVKWVYQWSVEGLSEGHRKNIKAQFWKAHAAFWESPDDPNADTNAMKLAFDGVARTLFGAGLLNEQLLAMDLPQLVWDSAIAGGWWRLAAEAPNHLFPEKLGHYWVWRDDSRDWNMLFGSETAEWRAKLLEVLAEGTAESDQSNGPDLQLAEALDPAPQTDRAGGKDRGSDTDTGPAGRTAAAGRARPFPSSITSLPAARRMEEFLERHNIGLTEFAGRVGTTDRTLRKFRQTGRVGRRTFEAIVGEMGTTRESLLKP